MLCKHAVSVRVRLFPNLEIWISLYVGDKFLCIRYIKVEANEIFFYRNLDNLVLGRKIYEKEQLRKLYF